MRAPQPTLTDAENAGQNLQDSFKTMPARIVNALQQADFVQDITGMRAHIIANATVLYPILTTKRESGPPMVLVPDLFVVTTGTGGTIQAAVLQQRANAVGLTNRNHTIDKDVLIKGPIATTTGKALEGLLRQSESLMAERWGEYMKIPLGHNPVTTGDGSVLYRKA